jgi:CBS domain-containing protein
MPGGGTAVVCSEPHCVPTDWQMVETEAPATVVRDIMTSSVVDVGPGANVTELARLMLDRGIHRLVVLDADRRPIGIVAVNDLLQVLAHPELTPAGGQA